MKIPAVAIAAAFAGGILFGLHPWFARHISSSGFLVTAALCSAAALAVGLYLSLRNHLLLGGVTSLFSWMLLGAFACCLSQQPLPTKHISNRIVADDINLKSPLKWYGRLMSEPARLPWGYSFDLALSGVDANGGHISLAGGLRAAFTPKDDDLQLPPLHAGDDISILLQAHPPLIYRDAGAFNRREFLARQNIDMVGTLRSSNLVEVISPAKPTFDTRLAGMRARLRRRVDELFPTTPQTAGVLRAMLLGDRTFIDRAESVDFQKTGVFHVLVVAGLHVGALAFFLAWLFRRMRLPHSVATLLLLTLLLAYVAVVEQRVPVLRAGLMVAIVVVGSFFYRRLDLLNSAGIAALILLVANPKYLTDAGFQLSFLAIGCIAGLAAPWMELHTQPYLHALRGWRDRTRDVSHCPSVVQFRLDVRDACQWMTSRIDGKLQTWMQDGVIKSLGASFRLSELFVLSFFLQLGMLPLMARDFHRIPLLGPVANLFVVPLTGVIVPLGFLSLSSSLAYPALGKVVAWPLSWLVMLQARIVSSLAHIPRSSYRIPAPPVWVLCLFFGSALLLAASRRIAGAQRHRLFFVAAVGLLLAGGLIAVYPFSPTFTRNALEVTVLDVGQGDSILVVSPRGSTLLIDAGGAFEGFRGRPEHLGPDPGEDAVSPYLWSRGFQKLNAVAVTHAHQDHIGGMTAILDNFEVGRVWIGNDNSAPALLRLKAKAEQLHVPLEHERRGQRFVWDGVEVDFMWPDTATDEDSPIARNNDSLVVRLHYGDRTILLPGDAEKQVEYEMLLETEARQMHADVLKIGHHGSKNSSMPEFLAAVAPQIAIISAGEQNPYGHPSPELLERLKESGPRVLRTDRDGAIQILTDGRTVTLNCFIDCPVAENLSGSAHAPDDSQRDE